MEWGRRGCCSLRISLHTMKKGLLISVGELLTWTLEILLEKCSVKSPCFSGVTRLSLWSNRTNKRLLRSITNLTVQTNRALTLASFSNIEACNSVLELLKAVNKTSSTLLLSNSCKKTDQSRKKIYFKDCVFAAF